MWLWKKEAYEFKKVWSKKGNNFNDKRSAMKRNIIFVESNGKSQDIKLDKEYVALKKVTF